jgi:hypothetical protein
MKPCPARLLFVLLLAMGFALLVLLDGQARNAEPEQDPVTREVSLPSAAIALISFGVRPLVADYLWIDAVQYIGKTLAHHEHDVVDGRVVEVGFAGEDVPVAAENVYRLVKRLTEVDPNFVYPYYITSLFLLDPHIEPDYAMDLLQSGVEHNPENWFLRTCYGYQLFTAKHDVVGALRELDIAVALPGAAAYVRHLRQGLSTASPHELTEMFLKGALRRATTDMERARIRQQLDDLEAGRDLGLEDLDHYHHHHHSGEHEHHQHDEASHDYPHDQESPVFLPDQHANTQTGRR